MSANSADNCVLTACPNDAQLEALLRDSLPPDEREALTAHIGECPACQRALDALATGPLGATLLAAESAKPPSESAYWAAVERLHKQPTRELPAKTPVPPRPRTGGVALDFLSPADDPAFVGMMDHIAILGLVGQGGMGLVLRGRDTCLQREVAVKVLAPSLAQDEVAQERFCREARAAAQITHENVVTVHSVDKSPASGLPYLVMQLVEGESLADRLERDGRPELMEVVRVGREVAEGLAAAHARGLIHRDIKPANVLLERGTGRVKLTDFGLARAAEDVRLTRSGMVAGTPLYMSPEQARGEEVDHRGDLFSLGVLLYELCTGSTPFEARTPLAVMKRLTEEPHVPVRQLRPDAPEWLTDVIDRLLAKRPADRFQSARETADLLDRYHTALKTSSAITPACPNRRRKRIQLTILTLAALATGALLTVAGMRVWPGRAVDGAAEPTTPPLAVLRGGTGSVWGVAFSPGDRTLAMAVEDGTVKLWELESRSIRATLKGHGGSVWSAAFNKDRPLLVTSSDDNTVRIWNLDTNAAVKTLTGAAAMRAAALGPDGDTVFTADRGGGVRVWGVESGEERRAWRNTGAVFALAVSPDGKNVAGGGSDGVVRLWDAATGAERLSLTRHAGPVYSVAFRPDGKALATAGWDDVIRLWNPATGDLIRSLEGHSHGVWAIDFAPDGKTLASAGQDGTVRVWNVETGKQLAVLRGHDGTVHAVAFSRDGGQIASGGRDGTVHLWASPTRDR